MRPSAALARSPAACEEATASPTVAPPHRRGRKSVDVQEIRKLEDYLKRLFGNAVGKLSMSS